MAYILRVYTQIPFILYKVEILIQLFQNVKLLLQFGDLIWLCIRVNIIHM